MVLHCKCLKLYFFFHFTFSHFYIVPFLLFRLLGFYIFERKCTTVELWSGLVMISHLIIFFILLGFYIFTFSFWLVKKEVCKCGVEWWWSLTSITGTIFPIGHNLPDSSVRLHFTIQPPSINNLTIPTIHLDLHPSILSPFSAVHFLCCQEYIIRFYSELVWTINIH